MCKLKKNMKPNGSNYTKFRSIIPILRVTNPLKKFQHKPCKCQREGCNISPGKKAELEELYRHRHPKQSQLMSFHIQRKTSYQSQNYLYKTQAQFAYYLKIDGRQLPACKETIKQIFGMTDEQIHSCQTKLKQDLQTWRRRYKEKLMCIRAANSIKRRYTKQVLFDMCQIPDFPTPPMSPVSISDDSDIFEFESFINNNDGLYDHHHQTSFPLPVHSKTAAKRQHSSEPATKSTAKRSKVTLDVEGSEAKPVSIETNYKLDVELEARSNQPRNTCYFTTPQHSGLDEKPRCFICEEYRAKVDSTDSTSEKEQLLAQLSKHQSQAQAALKSYKYDISRIQTEKNKTLVVIGIEIQKMIFTSELQVQRPHLRNENKKLNCNEINKASKNYHHKAPSPKPGISDTNTLTDTLWSDKDTEKGANEISSCLWKYFTRYKPLKPGDRRELILWTETCSGRSMNLIILALLILSVRKNIFSSACHKMFYPGHSIFQEEEREDISPLPVQNSKVDSTCEDDGDCNRNLKNIGSCRNNQMVIGKERKCTSLAQHDPDQNQYKHRQQSERNVSDNISSRIVSMEGEDFLDFKKVYELIRCPSTLNISDELCLKYDQDRGGILMSKNQHLLDRWKDHTLPNYTKKVEKRRSTLHWNWEKIDCFTPPKLFSEAVLRQIHRMTIPKDFQHFYVDMLKYSQDFNSIYSERLDSNSPQGTPKWLETIQDLEESLQLLQDADNHWDGNSCPEHPK